MLQETSEFSYNRGKTNNFGFISTFPNGKPRSHPDPHRRLRGILLQSSLVITTCGLPLGIAAVKLWTRKEFKRCNAWKRKIKPTRIPIEEKENFRWLENIRQSTRFLARHEQCVHIEDRERVTVLSCSAWLRTLAQNSLFGPVRNVWPRMEVPR